MLSLCAHFHFASVYSCFYSQMLSDWWSKKYRWPAMLGEGDVVQQPAEHHPRLPHQSPRSVWRQSLRGEPGAALLTSLQPGLGSAANALKTWGVFSVRWRKCLESETLLLLFSSAPRSKWGFYLASLGNSLLILKHCCAGLVVNLPNVAECALKLC